MTESLIFHQLFEHESSTYSYLLADPKTREAVLIDPVLETVDRDLKLIDEMDLKLILILDTHIHADHVTGAGLLRSRLRDESGADVRTAMSRRANVSCVDIPLDDGQELRFGSHVIRAIATPGHTDACMSYYVNDGNRGMIFTGDALLIGGTGRTDFQQGSPENLYHSVTEKLFRLPESTAVYPGHDYRGLSVSSIGQEKRFNSRLGGGKSLAEFTMIMRELKLAHPKKIAESLPANLMCGQPSDVRIFHPQRVNGILEITPEDLYRAMRKGALGGSSPVQLIDVRRPEEYVGEYGHVVGARLVMLGPDLEQFLAAGDRSGEIVFICRSGGRSGHAAGLATELGYKAAINMQGGMIRWTDLQLPVER